MQSFKRCHRPRRSQIGGLNVTVPSHSGIRRIKENESGHLSNERLGSPLPANADTWGTRNPPIMSTQEPLTNGYCLLYCSFCTLSRCLMNCVCLIRGNAGDLS